MSQQGMTVGLTGATGFVGRHTARALLDAGHRVRALVRDRRKAKDVLPLDHEDLALVDGSLSDIGALTDLARDCDAVVHTVGIRREEIGQHFDQVHVEGTRAVLNAAARAGAGRYIQISALGVRDNAPTEYFRTKWEAETLVRQSGLDWTILRPSIIHGPDGEFMGMVRDWAIGRTPPYAFMPYFLRFKGMEGFPPAPAFETPKVAPVSVDDVAGAVVASLERDEAIGEVYPLVGPETLEWPELLKAVRDRVELASDKKPVLGIPGHLGLAAAILAKPFGLAGALPFGSSEPVMAMEDSTASRAKVTQQLGLHAKPFTATLDTYAAQL